MKYLKKIFESCERDELVADVTDMLLELNDEGFECTVSNPVDPNLPAFLGNIPDGYKLVKTHDLIQVNFCSERRTRYGFQFDDIKEVYYRIKGYLSDNGYLEDLDHEKEFYQSEKERKKIRGAGAVLYYPMIFKKPL